MTMENEYPTISIVIENPRKSRSHPHLYLISCTSYLISFTPVLLNDPLHVAHLSRIPMYFMQSKRLLIFIKQASRIGHQARKETTFH